MTPVKPIAAMISGKEPKSMIGINNVRNQYPLLLFFKDSLFPSLVLRLLEKRCLPHSSPVIHFEISFFPHGDQTKDNTRKDIIDSYNR
jgi:hypothetical protein